MRINVSETQCRLMQPVIEQPEYVSNRKFSQYSTPGGYNNYHHGIRQNKDLPWLGTDESGNLVFLRNSEIEENNEAESNSMEEPDELEVSRSPISYQEDYNNGEITKGNGETN